MENERIFTVRTAAPPPPPFKRIRLNLILSFIGLCICLLSAIYYLSGFRNDNTTISSVEHKIKQLDEIRVSLVQIDKYFQSQQQKFKELSKTLSTMEDKKKRLESILSVEDRKIQLLLEHQAAIAKEKLWIGRVISFLVGVFSSLTASILVNFIRIKRGLKRTVQE